LFLFAIIVYDYRFHKQNNWKCVVVAVRGDVLLIENPPFRVNLQHIQAVDNSRSLLVKIQEVSVAGFLYIKFFFSAVYQSVKSNVQYMPASFKYCVIDPVMNSRRLSKNELIVYLCIWAIVHVIGLVVMSVIYFIKEMKSHIHNLVEYAHRAININHIQIKEVSIDVSHVPEEIQVDKLLQMFDQINFTHPDRPGYISQASLRGSTRNNLADFVRRIQQREAFLGTPPRLAYAQLMRFYEQIEKAVRFAIYKVTHDYDEFMQQRENIAPNENEVDDYRTYKNLLENKAILARDLTIAGRYCGARYMGEAMQAYFSAKGEEAIQGTMKEVLETILARRRKEIAETHIAVHLGQNTHDYSSYMASLGKLLGIPGTENVIEYLGGHIFDRHQMLRYFFADYTPDCIRDAVQTQYVSSQNFREMVFDWLKEQIGTWKEEEYQQKLAQVQQQANACLQQGFALERSETFRHITLFQQLWEKLLEQGVITTSQDGTRVFALGNELPDIENNWEDFIADVFALESARDIFKRDICPQMQLPHPLRLVPVNMQKRNRLLSTLNKDHILPFIKGGIKARATTGQFTLPEELLDRIILEEKIYALNGILNNHNLPNIAFEVLQRAIQTGNVPEILEQQLQMPRRNEFLAALFAHENHEAEAAHPPLNEHLLNWLLLTHGVLRAV